ncbi:VanZ family protein [Niabella drilacis]|uniref:VanZ like family protein n=1 Tax=Niabella drilacis (strain DSM 25811 / CCM 8410 / CCUG 62505 / LMG 26954 / E90) TaxID=1285928 RepID=A0A1G6Q325_NIADE|nr:VanZ family protein [Niabella drilacis]SDC86708.1 VanZ like family protein [Niabella drilacis]
MKTGLLFIGACVYFIITFVLLTLPGSAFPSEDIFDKIYFDKWVHIGLFSLLVFLWNLWVMRKGRLHRKIRIFIIVSIIAFLYGIIMEYVQKWYIPNRSFDPGDILADGAGAIMGLLASSYLYKKNRPL